MSRQEPTQINPSIEDACSKAVERILVAVPDILDAMIKKAKEGSQQHAKFLFDWAKLDPVFEDDQEEKRSSPSLAQILLDRLRQDAGESDPAHTTNVL